MRFGLLLRINAVAGPDEEPQHQRKQQAHQSLNGSDRAFCVGDMLARKRMLQQDAEHAANENDAHDQHRPPDKCHRQPHSASIAPNGRAPGRRVAYARSPRQLLPSPIPRAATHTCTALVLVCPERLCTLGRRHRPMTAPRTRQQREFPPRGPPPAPSGSLRGVSC